MRLALAAILAVLALPVLSVGSDVRPVEASTCTIGRPDGAYAAEVEGSARSARVWRLYQAYFLRQPDSNGLQYWVNQSEGGLDLQTMSIFFERSDEFIHLYGSLDNAQFIALVYNNVMCRQPDATGFNYWLNQLNTGAATRGELMVVFSESIEFGQSTGTHWSVFANPYEASIASDGYAVVAIPGGQMVEADYSRVDFKASHERCSVASINGNWFHNPSSANPTPIGFAVIDGQQLPGSYNLDDRGILGERHRPGGASAELVWEYQGTFNLNSNLEAKHGRVLENWGGWQPYTTPQLDNPSEWRWAAGGIPLIVNGQVWEAFWAVPHNNYTHYTSRHSFVAFDKHNGTLVFGSTTAMNSAQLIAWAQGRGYDDLVKFDGGGSVEFNVLGTARVAGTPRNVPLWLGIGC